MRLVNPLTRIPVYYGWVILVLGILCTMTAAGMTFWAITIYIPAVVDELDVGRTEVAMTFTVGNIAGAIVSPFAGRWMDTRGARQTILVGVVVIAAALLVTSRATELWQIFAGWTVVSAARPLVFPISYSWLITRWFDRRRQMALGVLTTGFGLSGAAAVPVLSKVEDAGGWSSVMVFSAVVLLVVNGITALLFIENRPADIGLRVEGGQSQPDDVAAPEEQGFTAAQAVRTPVFWAMSLGFMLLFIGPSAVTLLQLDFFEDRGLQHGVAVITIAAALRGFARLPLGLVLGMIDRVFVLAILVALSQGLAVIAIVLSTDLPGILIFILLWSTGGAFVPMLEPILITKAFGVRNYGAIAGAVQTVSFWGSLIGPIGGGRLRDVTGSYDIAFTLFAVSLGSAAVLFAIASVLARSPAHALATESAGMTSIPAGRSTVMLPGGAPASSRRGSWRRRRRPKPPEP